MRARTSFIAILFLTSLGFTQPDMDISFLRGLGNTCAWDDAAAFIDSQFQAFTTLDLYGPTSAPIQNHDINYQGKHNAVVAHSMGGLMARSEIVEGDVFDHLITIGTPHTGAPITAQGAHAALLLFRWIRDLLQGPCATLGGGVWCSSTNHPYINSLGILGLPALVQALTPLGQPSTNQMIPGSSFLNNLNGNFAASLPSPIANNRFIVGIERWQHHYRFLESKVTNCNPEYGRVAGAATALGVTYYLVARSYSRVALRYYKLYRATRFWPFLTLYHRFAYGASAWYQGAVSLLYKQQLEWSTYMDGSRTSSIWWPSDGFVPYYSQAAVGLMPVGLVNICYSINHNEETKHPNAMRMVRRSLQQVGVY